MRQALTVTFSMFFRGYQKVLQPSLLSLAFIYARNIFTNLNCSRALNPNFPAYKAFSLTANQGVKMPRHLNQQEAIAVDEELFNDYKFSVEQLMEMAGMSVATTVAKVYDHLRSCPVLVICGPGNNGGDGLVAARHLKLFGFDSVTILSTRKPTKDLYARLIHQAELNDVAVKYDIDDLRFTPSLIIDGLFGFSFNPPVRPDTVPHLRLMAEASGKSIPVVAIDIPSGWNVEKGPDGIDKSLYFMPDTLVSLTAPKLCAQHFTGPHHYLGGRFVPKRLEEKYKLELPNYPDQECIVKL